MLGMLKRHEVTILLKAGHPKAEVARLSGVSLRSVNLCLVETRFRLKALTLFAASL